jgi:thymidine phosphorylase
MTDRVKTFDEGVDVVVRKLEDGSALEKFKEMIAAQGVDENTAAKVANYDTISTVLPKAKFQTDLKSESTGW